MWEIILRQEPETVFMAPPCGPFSNWQNMSDWWTVQAKQKKAMPLIDFCIKVAHHQLSHGRYFIIENPQSSQIWNLPKMLQLAEQIGVTWNILDQCMYGLHDPVSGLPHLKPTCLMHNLMPSLMIPCFRRCERKHQHEQLQGSSPGSVGHRTAAAQVYPKRLCQTIARAIKAQHAHKRIGFSKCAAFDDDEQVIIDICQMAKIDSVELLSGLNRALETTDQVKLGLNPPKTELKDAFDLMGRLIHVSDRYIRYGMNLINALPAKTLIDCGNPQTARQREIVDVVKMINAKYLPNQEFSHAYVSRGTLDHPFSISPDTYVVAWKKKGDGTTVKISRLPLGLLANSGFDVSQFSFVWFHSQTAQSKPDEPMPQHPIMQEPPGPPFQVLSLIHI